MKKKSFFAVGVALTLLGTLSADSQASTSRLYLKPAYELNHKEQVILDILNSQDVQNTRQDFSGVEEQDGRYPEAIEKAYSHFSQLVSDTDQTQDGYSNAINGAANQLVAAVNPQTKLTKCGECPSLYRGEVVSLLIGINYKNTSSELRNCIHDIEHMRDILLAPVFGVRRDRTIFMSDNQYGTSMYPTAYNIRTQMKHFASMINKTKCGFFHYSGHGTKTTDYSGDEADRQDELLVPVDYNRAGCIKDDEVFNLLVKNLDSDVKLSVVTDCCHSGTILDLPYRWTSNGYYYKESKLSSSEIARLPEVVMLSGCRDDQVSMDGAYIPGETKGAGAMTAAFLTTVRKYNYTLTYRQLLEGVHSVLVSKGFKQKPQLSSTRMIRLDDYYMKSSATFQPYN